MIQRTALDCLVAVARHHGLDLSADRLAHDFALGEAEPATETILRMASERGLRARVAQLDWDALAAQPRTTFPLLLRLSNGNTVVALGFTANAAAPPADGVQSDEAAAGGAPAEPELIVADPLADGGKHLPVGRAQLALVWRGEAILIGRDYALGDENQPFGLRWFLPEALRQKSLFRDVIVAALVMHVVALALPIYFQIVIDKALTHQSYSTLYVLSIGAVLCVLFEAAFGFVRQYLLLYASNRIDLRVAARVFSHLLSLPVAFFERISAGVLVQHMQQARKVREFLTGKLLLTLLEASALIVFIPVLTSVRLKRGLDNRTLVPGDENSCRGLTGRFAGRMPCS